MEETQDFLDKNRNGEREKEKINLKELLQNIQNDIEEKEWISVLRKMDALPNMNYKREYCITNLTKNRRENIYLLIYILLTVLFLYMCLIHIGTLMYSNKYVHYATLSLIINLLFITIDIVIIVCLKSRINFEKRYNKYISFLKLKEIESTNEIAFYTKNKVQTVVKDLKFAIRNQLIPYGHFSNDYHIVMISNKKYNEYLENKKEYDNYYRDKDKKYTIMEERSKLMEEIIEQGKQWIRKMFEIKSKIRKKELIQWLEIFIGDITVLIYEIDIEPEYIETIENIIEQYCIVMETVFKGHIQTDIRQIRSNESKDDIDIENIFEQVVNRIVDSFEGSISRFYQEIYEENIF